MMDDFDLSVPLDILCLILNEIKATDPSNLRKLRLVSKSMNNLAGPLVFEDLNICITRETAAKIQDQLPAIASGRSPHVRWTKRVSVDRIVPVEPRDVYDPIDTVRDFTNETERKTALECQASYLTQAIRALENVEVASYRGTDKGPYLDVLLSLAQLPKLRELSLALDLYDDDTPLPLDEFSELRILKFHSLPISLTILSAAGRMIARCPDLAELHAFPTVNSYKLYKNGGNPVRPAVNIETIFEESMRSSNFVPKLKKLTTRGSGFKLSSTALPYLRALVHLEIEENVDASFWQALAAAQVHLVHLVVDPSSPGLLCYLASYSGLKDLHFAGLYLKQSVEVPLQVFHQVLPRHSLSLQNLSFKRLTFDVWAITEEYIESILKCHALQTLSVLYHYPAYRPPLSVGSSSTQDASSNGSTINLLDLLTCLLDGLPNLWRLRLKPTRAMPDFGFCGNGYFDYLQSMNDAFWKEICELKIPASRNSLLELQLLDSDDPLTIYKAHVSSIPLRFTPGDCRFKPAITSTKSL
ncbi:hypothetical protein H1R20_g10235, partial [Candolleomyces eurysporus]